MQLKGIKYYLVFIFIANLYGQYFDVEHYTNRDGLHLNTVTAIHQDYKGFMWVATSNHLMRFNGKQFEDFNIFDNKIHNLIITDIESDSTGLFLVSNQGLIFYDFKKSEYIRYSQYSEDFGESFKQLISYNSGTGWLQGKNNLLHFDKNGQIIEKLSIDKFYSSSETDFIFNEAIMIQDKIWVATSAPEIFIYDTKSKQITEYPFANLESGDLIREFYLEKNQFLWIGTKENGAFRIDINTNQVKNYGKHNGLTSDYTGAICEFSNDYIMIGTWGEGINFLDINTNVIHNTQINDQLKENFSSDMIYCVYKDRQNNLWIGSFNDGLYCIYAQSNRFKIYDIPCLTQYLHDNNIRVFRIDNGLHYLGTKGDGLLIYDKQSNNCEKVKLSDDYYSNYITEIVLQDSIIWLATRNGLAKYNKKTGSKSIYKIRPAEGATSNAIFNLCQESDSTLVVTFSFFARFNINSEQFEHLKMDTTEIDFLRFTKFQDYWVGTSPKIGIFVLDKTFSKVKSFEVSNSIINTKHVYDIEKDNEVLWISTHSGIFKLDKDLHLSVVDTMSFSRGSVITDLIASKNALWCGTNNGLYKYDKFDGEITAFDEYSHLPSLSFIWWGGAKDSSGLIYFCSKDGIIYFDPMEIEPQNIDTKSIITNIKLLNPKQKSDVFQFENVYSNIYLETPRKLTVHESDIFTIQFATTNYIYPKRNQFAYKLEGLDNEWTVIGGRQEITYHHLPKGHYKFNVKCSADVNNWDAKATSFDIIVLPTIWNSLPFKLFLFFLLGTGIYLLIYYRNTIHETKENELKEINYQLQKEIKHRQEAEGQLLESNSLLNSIMNAARDVAIIATDKNGIITYFNRGAELLLEYSQEEVIGKMTPEDYHDADEIALRRKYILEKFNFKSNGIQIFTYLSSILGFDKNVWTYITKSGKEIKVELSVTVIKDDEELLGYLGVATDITQRLNDEKVIQENQRKLTTLLGNIQGMAYRCLIDEKLTMKYISPGAYELTGYLPDEMIENNLIAYSEIILKKDKYFDQNYILKKVSENKPFELNYRIITKDKKIKWVWEKGCAIYDKKGKAGSAGRLCDRY